MHGTNNIRIIHPLPKPIKILIIALAAEVGENFNGKDMLLHIMCAIFAVNIARAT